VLWSGSVIDPSANDDNVNAIRAFPSRDARVERVMLPVSDGITAGPKD